METIFNADIISILGNFLFGIGCVAVLWAMGRSADEEAYDIYYDDQYYTDYIVDYDR